MNVTRTGLLVVGAAGLSLAMMSHHPVQSAIAQPPPKRVPNTAFAPASKPAVPEIAGYGTWVKVINKPQFIMSKLDLLCRMPTQAELDAQKQDPHVDHFMLCYVNSLGEQAMLRAKRPKFPVGSIVLKAKLDSEDPKAKRSLLTAMIKHKVGYDPSHGDWEYVVTNGDNSVLQARGKLANCGGCHAEKKNTDYVFRDEMGVDRLAKLR